MDETLFTIKRLLGEVAEHLATPGKANKTAAHDKLRRIAALATTLALTIKLARSG
jgi:hypothetical protein